MITWFLKNMNILLRHINAVFTRVFTRYKLIFSLASSNAYVNEKMLPFYTVQLEKLTRLVNARVRSRSRLAVSKPVEQFYFFF